MKLYKVVEELNSERKQAVSKHSILEKTLKLYAKMKKLSKSHRSVLDMNITDVHDTENIDIVNGNTIVQSDNKIEVKDEIIGLLLQKMNSM